MTADYPSRFPGRHWAWKSQDHWWMYSDNLQECPENTELWFRENSACYWTRFADKRAAEQQQINQTERKDSMLHTIAVTETPSVLDQQKGASERLVAGPETVLAGNQNTAMIIFGANHATEIKEGSPDRMVVNIRAGV